MQLKPSFFKDLKTHFPAFRDVSWSTRLILATYHPGSSAAMMTNSACILYEKLQGKWVTQWWINFYAGRQSKDLALNPKVRGKL